MAGILVSDSILKSELAQTGIGHRGKRSIVFSITPAFSRTRPDEELLEGVKVMTFRKN
jgi:hypothetical protein